MKTSPHANKREILARVRRGELDTRQAAALLRQLHLDAVSDTAGTSDSEHTTVWYHAGWAASAAGPKAAGATGALVLVLRPGASEGPDPQGQFVVPADAPVSWPRVWRSVSGTLPADARVVLDTREALGPAALDAAFALLRAIIEDRSRQTISVVVLTAGTAHSETADALGALCQIASQEDRRIRAVSVHVSGVPEATAPGTPLARAFAELALPTPGTAQVRYDRHGRAIRTLTPLPDTGGDARGPWRERGVYLITGGAGGIGAHMAELLARRYAARLVLLGRSAITPPIRRVLERVREVGGEAVYVQADVTDRGAAERALARAHEKFGPLTGVLHAAGVNEDAYLVNKDPRSVHRVLAPKVTGAAVLDEVTAAEPLEMFVLFSSVAAYIGGPGQSDYAAANRSLGALAAARAEAVARGIRRGTTVSLSLPLIAGGGMDLDERDKRAARDLHGMAAMAPDTLLDTLGTALVSERPEVFVMHGDAARIRMSVERHLSDRPSTSERAAVPNSHGGPGDGIATAAETYLLSLVSEIIRLPAGRLRPDQELSTVGVDSVLIKKISTLLEDRLGPLPATLLFDYRTVGELSRYLVAEHTAALRDLLVPQALQAADPAQAVRPQRDSGKHRAPIPAQKEGDGPGPDSDEPIAIIGVAGRYPGGRDLDTYWETLRDGKDAITEVPADRWDHTRYYAPGERTGGKTYSKWGGFIEDADRFDTLYFNISPRDAERADPTERVFLEVAWSALENAGYSRRLLHQRTRRGDEHALGVFVGVTATSYKLIGAEEWGKNNPITALSMDFSAANRLSYLLDAHGPSLVVDTACSSSLTALHLAVESLRRGECVMAISGGAHIQTHPIKYGVLADMRLLSTDGRCRAFGAGGDGFVPSEGAGALVLKPLSAALADGDHVHGVIRATSVNHGGRTNGYTVPSPRAHASVISAALRRAGVSADTIGYVEAHGTGTALGDPIEVEGLRRAFAEHTDRTGYCAIGSAKSNIGHAESAAGVAGVTKVLLQFAHGQLAPSLHSAEVNPKVDFSHSPFVLQRELGPWERLEPYTPRRAAVSSFGAGGSNGHVILEEAPKAPLSGPVAEDGAEWLIVLSAKTDERLREVVHRLHHHLGARPDTCVADVACTLATGRDELESRLAVAARTVSELRDRLRAFLDTGSAEALVTGHTELAGPAPATPERTRDLLAARDWSALARIWVDGGAVDWTHAFPGARRIPLPAYPFAGDRHWVATTPPLGTEGMAPYGVDGPLERMVPTLDGLAYETEFTHHDQVVRDHVVAGRALLAGVVHLRMAIAAAERLEQGRVRAITDVRWRTPLEIAETGTTVRVALTGSDQGLEYTINTAAEGTLELHSTGTVHLGADPTTPPSALDLEALRARGTDHHEGGDFYTNAEHGGLVYGPLFRRLASVRSSAGGEVVGELTDPPTSGAPAWAEEAGALDGALHALHGVLPPASPDEPPLLPASVARVELHGRLGDARHVHVRLRSHDPERGTARADVTLADEHGVPIAVFHDLRVARPAATTGADVRHLRTAWQVLETTPAPAQHTGHTLILTTDRDFGLGQALAARYDSVRLLRLDAPDVDEQVERAVRHLPADSLIHFLAGVDDRIYSAHDLAHLDTSLDQGCLALFRLAKLLADRRPEGLRLSVVTSDSQQIDECAPARNPYAAAIIGLAKSLARELPFAEVSCLDLDRRALARGGAELPRIAEAVHTEPPAFPVQEVALRGGVRLGKTLRGLTLAEPSDEELPFRRGGTYLLVGGAGGLGRAVARHLARQYAARLVLIGRRPLDQLPDTLLSELREAGGEAVYEQADIADREAAQALVTRVRQRFGPIHGAVHAAFTLADSLLTRMDEPTFRRALHAKAHGTVVLAEALTGEPLDFLALFSSAVSHRANAGQANYSAASTFQDTYAHHLSARTHLPVKLFNWGLWGHSGSVATEDYRRRVARLGVAGLTDEEGVAAFLRVMGSPLVQATVLKTTGDDQGLEGVTDAAPDTLEAPGDGLAVRAAAAGAAAVRDAATLPSGYLDRLDDLARRETLAALRGMGLPRTAVTARTPDQLATDLGVAAGQRRLFDALLDAVHRAGLVREDGGRLSFPVDPYERTGPMELRERLVDDHPFCAPTVELIADCAAALPDVLTGRRRGLEVLFPGGSQDRLAALYHGDPRAKHFNEMCTAAVVRRVTELRRGDADREITVLEIGAGTGGTTRPLLTALRECGDRPPAYVCTDISPTLVRQAAERFGPDHPEATFRTLDIAAAPASQGYAEQRYDIVVAANVLHATGDLRATLHHVAALMRPGALLAINESTAVLDAVTLVFGLTEGWWLYEDGHLRLPHSPLLGAEDWRAVLAAEGLRDVRTLAATRGDGAHADQSLVLAERGNVRFGGAGAPDSSAPKPRPEPAVPETGKTRTDGGEGAQAWLVERLRTRFAMSLKLAESELDATTPLLTYGVDSLVVMDVTDSLERDLGWRVTFDEALDGKTLTEVADLLLGMGVPLPEEAAGPTAASAAPHERPRSDETEAVDAEPVGEERTPADTPAGVPIAVIGVAGRYPGASDLREFWDNLLEGHRSIREIPADRWNETELSGLDGSGHGGHRWGGFLDDVDHFDSLLFRISPREAAIMDPQERLLLETAWTALEDAAVTRTRLEDAAVRAAGAGVGVFAGAMHTPYQSVVAERWGRGERPRGSSSTWALANRISHCFGFSGPSIAVNSACSSSLTALHLACEAIRRGECGAALVGGVNLILHPSHHADLAAAKMLSGDGRVRVFDEDGDGMVTGEGVGVVVLKPLPEALRTGDRVHAVITGSSVNHNAGDSTYTTPDADAQAVLLRTALRRAGLRPDDVQYVEAAATGSPLGDSVEAQALERVFDGRPTERGPVYVGTLKPNVGHLEAASGMAQFAKVLLQLKAGRIAPTMDITEPLPVFSVDGSALRVVAEPVPWPGGGTVRCAAVSSFGAGGANAQLIVQAPPEQPERPAPEGPQLVTLSARRPQELRRLSARLRDFLRGPGSEENLADIAHTLRVGREPLRERVVFVAHDVPELVDALGAVADGDSPPERGFGALPEPWAQLAVRWAEGGDVDWREQDSGGRVISLPGYPFAPERHWIAEPASLPVTGANTTPPAPATTVSAATTEHDRDTVYETVVAAIGSVLGLPAEEVGLDEHLSDFGFDSISLTELAGMLSDELAISVLPPELYAHTDVASLVAALAARLPAPKRSAQTVAAAPAAGSVAEEPIAIVGMAGRFPGSPDLDAYWENLAAGRDLIEEIPADRFDWRDIYGDPREDPERVPSRWGGFLSGIDGFDPEFFRISPREARTMDPQHRLFLHAVWQAIEDAGHDPTSLEGTRTGVFVGVGSTEYAQMLIERGVEIDGQAATGNAHSVLANRVSFLLGLHGPSEPLDTACSSSLTAIHRAVQAIRAGECDAALAGGVNALLSPTGFLAFGKSGMLSPDGRCKTFDHRADGYVRGEGVAAILLKPLSRAQADGDHVYALVRGTAVNHGGRANSLTAPNPQAQTDVIVRAHRAAGVSADTITYVEAHGTGTALGDPIEVNGLVDAFRALGSGGRTGYCALGSVKTNVGHLETAAGVAGLIKVVKALQHRQLPPSLHMERVNPLIDLTDAPFYLLDESRPWSRLSDGNGGEVPRRAGISSFGFGGVNAHVMVEEYQPDEPSGPMADERSEGPHLFVLSARTEERLRRYATALADSLERTPRRPADVAHTLRVGRPALDERLAVIAHGIPELVERLRAYADGFGRREPDLVCPLQQLAVRWVRRKETDWSDLDAVPGRRVPLPTYPFEEDRYWLPEPAAADPFTRPKQTTATVAVPPEAVPAVRPEPVSTVPGPAPAPVYQRQSNDTGRETPAMETVVDTTGLAWQLRELVAQGVGLTPEEIDPAKDFAVYGIDSIVALRIMQRVQAKYGDEIPMAAIFEYASLDRLVEHIAALNPSLAVASSAPHEALLVAEAGPATVTRPEPRSQAHHRPQPQSRPQARVIPFVADTTGVPVYCLPGDTGELSWLTHMRAALAGDGAVLGIEPPGFGTGRAPLTSATELAEAAADAIVGDRPGSPCRIAGQGIGGVIAFEVARCLADRGHQVDELLLIGAPEPGARVPRGLGALTGVFGTLWGAHRRLGPDVTGDGTADGDFADAARVLTAHAHPPMSEAALTEWLREAHTHRTALAEAVSAHEPRPLAGPTPITVVRALVAGEPATGDWQRWLVQVPRTIDLPSRPDYLTSAGAAVDLSGLHRSKDQRPQSSRRFITSVNQAGDKQRSYWMHHMYGDVSYSLYLSRFLGPDYPLMGVEQVDVDSNLHRFDTFQEMCAEYAAAVRADHPGGPVTLAGSSFGGVVAYEVARQLLHQGERIRSLIVADGIMPTTPAWAGVDWSSLTDEQSESLPLMMLGNSYCHRWHIPELIDLQALLGKEDDEQLRLIARHVVDKATAKLSYDHILLLLRRTNEAFNQNVRLLTEYVPQPLPEPVDVTFFHATQGFVGEQNTSGLPAMRRLGEDRTNGFGQFIGKPIRVHDVDADHFTIVHDQGLRTMARLMTPALGGPAVPETGDLI
ncbi:MULTISPECIES: SDR family NAD(P)-dependent oxidoreductase [Streptomyces]|uniref:SDR family NAD(P)-dependent oxidoreductase n=1 Tax=Streptomyces lycopersici TaxID=2974589 RepID=UPI0021CE3880|nr:SDR family NAD(P)-dependent oxidoreductase [Streptomyces sp. NEAU-383]